MQTPVLAQVSALFKNDPDLMEEFGNFLPEAMGPGPAQHGLVGIMPHPVAVAPPSANWDQGTETPPAGTEKPKPPRRRKRGPEKEAPVAAKVTTGRVSISFCSRPVPLVATTYTMFATQGVETAKA